MADAWVSVKERLPEPGKNCWVSLPRKQGVPQVFVAQRMWNGDGWCIPGSEFHDAGRVTHWQPYVVPAPPKETANG